MLEKKMAEKFLTSRSTKEEQACVPFHGFQRNNSVPDVLDIPAHLDWEDSSADLRFMTGRGLTLPTDRLHSRGGFLTLASSSDSVCDR